MNPEDRACFNCKGSSLLRIPNIGATSESDYMGMILCKQGLSDHYRHYLSLQHMCPWHSDTVKDDTRYPNWEDTIDKEKDGSQKE